WPAPDCRSPLRASSRRPAALGRPGAPSVSSCAYMVRRGLMHGLLVSCVSDQGGVPMRTSRFSFVVIVVLFALAGVANAHSAKIRINGPGEVADSGDGPKKAFFTVDLFFDYKLVECKPNNPDC